MRRSTRRVCCGAAQCDVVPLSSAKQSAQTARSRTSAPTNAPTSLLSAPQAGSVQVAADPGRESPGCRTTRSARPTMRGARRAGSDTPPPLFPSPPASPSRSLARRGGRRVDESQGTQEAEESDEVPRRVAASRCNRRAGAGYGGVRVLQRCQPCPAAELAVSSRAVGGQPNRRLRCCSRCWQSDATADDIWDEDHVKCEACTGV